MRIIIIFVLMGFLFLSCKAAKERRACLKLTSENETLAIENFEELKAYTKVNWVKLLGATWILDGEIISDELLKNKINKKKFDILELKVLEGDKITLSHKKSTLIILISSNNCLNK